MTRHRFEAIASFLHVVSLDEEQELANDPLKKIKPLHNYIKRKCFKLYQPLREVSIDERMVKNKGRHRFGQYMKSKPIKWGLKYWVLADPTGYSVDFNLYLGSAESHSTSENGLAYDVVQKLISPLVYQRYFLFCDNFYSSPKLFCDLLQEEVYCTGTVNINRRELPSDVKGLIEGSNG
jgi:DNA excision repair protein ERCC-6